ncbi:MAG: hypothetical protein JWQ85_1378 [Mucilaginibacter sp.]|nr:hypothetical protein [Mucilaginibacter sp.]
MPLPAKRAEPRAGIFCPTAFALCPRFSKISYALASLKATIVLPAFARSCFVDGGEKRNSPLRIRTACDKPAASLFTHPDCATLVAPLCCAKRVRRNAKPSFRLRREGGRAKQRPGESICVRDCSGYRPVAKACACMSEKPGPKATP